MKKFEAVFWRGNPQLANGGYETKRQFNAKSFEGAKGRQRNTKSVSTAAWSFWTFMK